MTLITAAKMSCFSSLILYTLFLESVTFRNPRPKLLHGLGHGKDDTYTVQESD
jgi:hypothetical protein